MAGFYDKPIDPATSSAFMQIMSRLGDRRFAREQHKDRRKDAIRAALLNTGANLVSSIGSDLGERYITQPFKEAGMDRRVGMEGDIQKAIAGIRNRGGVEEANIRAAADLEKARLEADLKDPVVPEDELFLNAQTLGLTQGADEEAAARAAAAGGWRDYTYNRGVPSKETSLIPKGTRASGVKRIQDSLKEGANREEVTARMRDMFIRRGQDDRGLDIKEFEAETGRGHLGVAEDRLDFDREIKSIDLELAAGRLNLDRLGLLLDQTKAQSGEQSAQVNDLLAALSEGGPLSDDARSAAESRGEDLKAFDDNRRYQVGRLFSLLGPGRAVDKFTREGGVTPPDPKVVAAESAVRALPGHIQMPFVQFAKKYPDKASALYPLLKKGNRSQIRSWFWTNNIPEEDRFGFDGLNQ